MKLAQYLAIGLLLCAIHARGQQVTLRTITFQIGESSMGWIRVQSDGGVETSIVTNRQTASYPDGTRLTLTAVPNSGYRFGGWIKESFGVGNRENGVENPTTIRLDTDMTFVALWAAVPPDPVSIAWTDAAQDRARITWSDGTLLSANDITGPWTEVAGAVSPYDYIPGNHGFFRIRYVSGFYSRNVVGHLTLPIRVKYSALLTIFKNNVLPGSPVASDNLRPRDQEKVYTWKETGYTIGTYDSWFGDWDNIPTFHCWHGLIIGSTQARTWTAIGEVPEGGLDIIIPAGSRQLLGSPVPQAGRVTTDLQYPAEAGDRIYTMDEAWNYHSYYYTEFGRMPSEPRLEVGQAFWLCHPAPTELHWRRIFYVTP